MNSREKGKRGEREWRDELRAQGFTARRGQQFSGSVDSPDVVCEELAWLHFEVKRVQSLNLTDACAQAEGDCGGKPWVVAHRKNHAPWLITMRAEFFFDLVRNYLPMVGMQKPETPLSTRANERQTETFSDVPPFSSNANLGGAGATPENNKQNN